MLRLNIKRLFGLRGLQNPYRHLVKTGISAPTAWNLLEHRVSSIQHKHLEKICAYLNCTPNDLYEWIPDRDTLQPESHPLSTLRRNDSPPEYEKMIHNIPIDKIDRVKDFLAELACEHTVVADKPDATPGDSI